MSDTLFRSVNLIEPGDLVVYHGSIADAHGLYIAVPCACRYCAMADRRGMPSARYQLTDPWGERRTLFCAHRQSITRSTANA